ncbi:hypothetical protein BJV74DRAFT_189424 [Russula compacta]|nr:hypothetical protein BJV74DRAFT_189424 [Russula compacta]
MRSLCDEESHRSLGKNLRGAAADNLGVLDRISRTWTRSFARCAACAYQSHSLFRGRGTPPSAQCTTRADITSTAGKILLFYFSSWSRRRRLPCIVLFHANVCPSILERLGPVLRSLQELLTGTPLASRHARTCRPSTAPELLRCACVYLQYVGRFALRASRADYAEIVAFGAKAIVKQTTSRSAPLCTPVASVRQPFPAPSRSYGSGVSTNGVINAVPTRKISHCLAYD